MEFGVLLSTISKDIRFLGDYVFGGFGKSAILRKISLVEEIWRNTKGGVDILIPGVETGGTITGVTEVIKKRKPSFEAIAVEPAAAPVLSGGNPGPHKIQGIGADLIPQVLNTAIIDEVISVTNEQASGMAREAAMLEGILCGISSGTVLTAAIEMATKRPESRGKQIVIIFPSTGE